MSRSARLHADGLTRCPWPGEDPFYVAYHDTEWGVPEYDDRALYEKLILDGFQAGLSWITILRKRENFRAAFANFEPDEVARFGKRDVNRLLADTGIVRNRLKIDAAIANAKATVALRDGPRPLPELIWAHAPAGRRKAPRSWADVAALTPESTALAKELKRNEFRFVGPTTAGCSRSSASRGSRRGCRG